MSVFPSSPTVGQTIQIGNQVYQWNGVAWDNSGMSIPAGSLPNVIASYLMGFKNHIINGRFDLWQYAASQTTSGYGSDDRWYNRNTGSTKTHSQVACTDTERAAFNAACFSRTAVTSVAGAGNYVAKEQPIEDVTRLAGKQVSLSFWAKADTAKNIAVEFAQSFGTGGTPSANVTGIGAQLLALTNAWQKFTVTLTLPSIVGKTLGTDGVHTSFTSLVFWFDAGSNFATRAASLGQQSGTFDIANVQLEAGSVATPFENRLRGLELSLAQRYYNQILVLPKGSAQVPLYGPYGTTGCYELISVPPMRVIPTLSLVNSSVVVQYYSNGGVWTNTSASLSQYSVVSFLFAVVGDGGSKLARNTDPNLDLMAAATAEITGTT